jgi:hypothetical protein
MSFWEKIEKDIKKNIQEGLSLVKERGTAFSRKIERLTEEGKRKYKIFTLKMKVQDEFTRLGGKVYDLSQKSEDPMKNKKVIAIISRIKRLEDQITRKEREGKTKIRKVKGKSSVRKASK